MDELVCVTWGCDRLVTCVCGDDETPFYEHYCRKCADMRKESPGYVEMTLEEFQEYEKINAHEMTQFLVKKHKNSTVK